MQNKETETKTYRCEECKDKQFFVVDKEDGYTAIRRCKCWYDDINQERLIRSGIKNIERYTLSKYIVKNDWQKEIKDKAELFIKNYDINNRRWFWIGGQIGAGKTHICLATMINLSMRYNLNYKFFDFNAELTLLKQNQYDDKQKYKDLIYTYKNISILCIDDFFRTEPSKTDINIMFEILNYRYINDKITIINSQMKLTEFANLDEALASRIFEKSKNFRIEIERDISKNYRFS